MTAQSFANEGPQVVGYDWFSDQEVGAYDRAFAANGTERIDDATWRDLDVRAYLRLIAAQCSIFGRQMLFHRLRAGRSPQDLANTRKPATSCVDTEIAQTLFHGALVCVPRWTAHLWKGRADDAPSHSSSTQHHLAEHPGADRQAVAHLGGAHPHVCGIRQPKCEAQLCLMEHLKTRSVVCWAQPASTRHLHLQDMVNPLVGDAQPLSIALHGKGAFVSGQNGVGKSTFLRGLGLNLLAARAFGFCYAAEAKVPLLPVWSSIQNEDSLDTADSLYMAEMRRCETLLAVAERPTGAVFILDEIFRGTNHVESVSAAAAVINQLANRALVIVSSHHLVLAPLLHPKLEALRVVGDPPSNGSLRLEPGLLLETNGIHMMERYAIPEQVRATAIQVHDWLAGYMTRPDHFPELL